MSELEPKGPGPSAANVARSALQIARAGRHEHAARILRQRLGQSPLAAGEAAELRLVLARVMLDSAHAKAAVAELVQVLQIDAHRPDALLLLTEALIECNEAGRAKDILERAARSGGDPSRVSQLRGALEALATGTQNAINPDPPSRIDAVPVLIANDPFGDELDTPRPQGMFADDEETVPWLSDERPDTKPTPAPPGPASLFSSAEERAVVPQVTEALFEPGAETRADPDPDATLDAATQPRVAKDKGGLPVVYQSTGPAPELIPEEPLQPGSDPTTDPLGWSIGDPGRAAVGRNVPRPLIFDDNESTVTGSFHGLGQSVLEDVRRQVEAFRDRREVTPKPAPRQTPMPSEPAIALGSNDMLDADYVASQVIQLSSGEIESMSVTGSTAPSRSPGLPTAQIPSASGVPPAARSGAVPAPGSTIAPAARSGAVPAARSGAMPAARSGAMPAARSGAMPAARSGAMPAAGSGSAAASRSAGMSAAKAGVMPTPRSSAIPGPPPANAWPGPPPGWSDEILLQQTEPVALSQPMPEAKNPAQSGAIVHGVISETDIPIRPRERRHDHVARSGGLPLPSAAAPRLPPKPPRPPRPSRRARKPDLEAKLQVAQRRQVSRKATDQNIRSARTFAWGALVPLAILVIGTGILLAAALIFWPAAHHEAVVTVLDAEAEAARQGIRSDTYQGYLAASDHLTRAIDATGPGGTDLAGITEGYLATLGVDDIERLKLAALGDQAETHAVLEVRFGHEPAPSSRKLLAQLDALGAQSPQIASARAWRMIGRGELEAALNQLETDILTYPSSANLHYLRGLCLDRMGDHDLARQAWERAQVSDARHVPTRVALGGWHARRRSQLASDLFADVLDRLSPGHPGATIDRAGYWIATGQNTRQAREELDRVLDATTALSAVERAQAHYVRGLWFQANREPTKASDEFDAALRLDPANPMASAARIRLLIEDDDLKAATASLNQAELRGGAAKALRLLRGLLNLRSGEPAKAKEALGQVDGLDKEAQSLLGDILVELGDWRGAEAAYTRAQTLGDKTAAGDLNLVRAVRGNADALLHLQADTVKSSNPATSWRYGRARLERGDLDTAVAHLRKAHRLDPRGLFRHRIPPVADLCRLHAARGEILAAKKACDEAIARRPSYEAPHRIRARVATLEGDDATAFTLLSALSARHPTDVGITLDLARAQIHQGRLSEANQSIEKLVERSEASADLHVLQGLLELHRYRHGFALGYFQRALAARDGDAEAHLYAARCLLHTGRPSAALEHIRAARKDKQWAVPALTAASEYHRRQGDWRAASREANRALRQARRTVTPSRFVAEAHTALAKALEMRYGATDPAVTNELQKAARLDHAPAFYHLARIALARRDRPTYLQALQDAADRDPFLCPAVALLRREVRENPKLDVRVPDTCR